jgi:hypothetical protein
MRYIQKLFDSSKMILWLAIALRFSCCSLSIAQENEAGANATLKSLRTHRLQILNGLDHAIEVYRIDGNGARMLHATVEPKRHTVVRAEPKEQFAVVNPVGNPKVDSGAERQGTNANPETSKTKTSQAETGTGTTNTETILTSEVPVQAYRVGGVPACYTQRSEAQGFPIVATANVSPYALKEAEYLVDQMLAHRPDIRRAMILSGARLCIIGWNEFTTDLPEWEWLAENELAEYPGISPRDFYDARARGMGGSRMDPFCSCGEENLLCYPGDPYSTENILIHEFAHNIHLRGLVNVDPTFDERLKKAYDQAMQEGLWKSKYASVNHHEYFAEGVQSWFDNNREDDHDHNHVNTRQELIEYDPGLADLCREVFGETRLQYTKPQTRLKDHLAGYDPATAPTFRWPERLKHAQREILRRAQSR